MPELPEVETTIRALNKRVRGLIINDVWTNYNSPHYHGKQSVKDPKYFKKFKKEIIGKKFLKFERRAKNMIVRLSGDKSFLVHMKMTGHFLYGDFKKTRNVWRPNQRGALNDRMNQFIRMIFSLSNNKYLAFSDMRKFAKIHLLSKNQEKIELKKLGPEPLGKNFDHKIFAERLRLKPNWKIKTALMNPELVAGIGNIYSDEILWFSKIHPETLVKNIKTENFKIILKNLKIILKKSIKSGGDSMSDFRLLDGSPGKFQNFHKAYRQTDKKCSLKTCRGKIERKIINGRSAHFCNFHQKKL